MLPTKPSQLFLIDISKTILACVDFWDQSKSIYTDCQKLWQQANTGLELLVCKREESLERQHQNKETSDKNRTGTAEEKGTKGLYPGTQVNIWQDKGEWL